MKLNRKQIRKLINESIRSMLLERVSIDNITYKQSIMIGKKLLKEDLIKNILTGKHALPGCAYGISFDIDPVRIGESEDKDLSDADFKNHDAYLYLNEASVKNIVEKIIVGKKIKQSPAFRTPGVLGLEVLEGEYKGLLIVITGSENIDLYKQPGLFDLSNIKGNVDIRISETLPEQVPAVFYDMSGYTLDSI